MQEGKPESVILGNLRRVQQRAVTLQRRQSQVPLTIEVKVAKSRLNRVQEEHCKMLFLEEKWCHNFITGKRGDEDFDIFKFDYKELQNITHLDKDKNEVPVEITHMSQQMKQGFVSKYRANVKSLAAKKKNGEKVGSIDFKSEGSSIFLKQYGNGKTYEIVSKNRIKLQGLSKPLPVNGLKQLEDISDNIDENFEFSSATFDRDKAGDYFFHITIWVDKEKYKAWKSSKECILYDEVGIDFGCETTITTSYGEKFTPVVNESERLKRLQEKKSRQVKHSNRWWKTILAIRKEYRHMSNQKNDIANKKATEILRSTNKVVVQDEQLAAWQKGGHGKAVQHSVHGRVMDRFRASEKTIVLNRLVPTTKLCTNCGHCHKDIKLEDRTFVCPVCGHTEDRDVHASKNMVFISDNFFDVVVGSDGSSFNRADFDRRLAELFNRRPAGDGCSTCPEVDGG